MKHLSHVIVLTQEAQKSIPQLTEQTLLIESRKKPGSHMEHTFGTLQIKQLAVGHAGSHILPLISREYPDKQAEHTREPDVF